MKKKNYFEGWYFKEQTEDFSIALIPEISYGKNGETEGSLQIVTEDQMFYYEYQNPVIMNMSSSMFVVLDKNVFTDACIHLDIDDEHLKIKGDIYFENDIGQRFNVMGPLSFLPLQCRHKVISMEQELSGTLMINGTEHNFSGGKGYLESDFGTSFPRTYLWCQSNWFNERHCQIVMAAASIPVGKLHIMGTFACISYKGEQYKFATYKGAEVVKLTDCGFKIAQGPYIFEGRRTGDGTPVELKSPQMGQMNSATKEYLTCDMEFRLYKKGKEIMNVKSQKASFEALSPNL